VICFSSQAKIISKMYSYFVFSIFRVFVIVFKFFPENSNLTIKGLQRDRFACQEKQGSLYWKSPCSKLQGLFDCKEFYQFFDSLVSPAASCGECTRCAVHILLLLFA
jgi:hypothetical protein